MQKIILSSSDKEILTQYAENEKPNESCAILFGKDNTVLEVFLTKNIEESPVNFTISNEQLIEGYKIAEEKNVDVIGIFHSHPNSEGISIKYRQKIHAKQSCCMGNLLWCKQEFESILVRIRNQRNSY